MRHVIEHNWGWKEIIMNAISSIKKKMVLILFTPLSEVTQEMPEGTKLNKEFGIDVPNISFSVNDLINIFNVFGCSISQDNYKTNTQYGVETVFLITKAC